MEAASLLVVEDELITAQDIKNILIENGYNVPATVRTGEDAIHTAGTVHPDLVLMDIYLPGAIDGVEAARRIKSLYNIPIIYITAHSDEITLQRAKCTGPYGYILKPINRYELYSTIETALYKHNLEKLLIESEEKYRQLFSSVSDSIIIFNIDTLDIIDANHAALALYGYTRDEIAGLKMTDLSNEPAHTINYIREFSVNGPRAMYTRNHRRKDGSIVMVEITGGRFTLSNRSIGIETVRDITKRKKMEDELIRAQKLESVGILAGSIAHDFNNLLTAISGNITLLKMFIKQGNEEFESIQEIEKALDSANNLSLQLQNFSHLSKPAIDIVQIDEIIKDTLAFILDEFNVNTTYDFPVYLWHVRADPSQMRNVFHHIIRNACEAMPQDGNVSIAADNFIADSHHHLPINDGRYVRITITDEGAGIPPDIRDKIFEPNFSTKIKYNDKSAGLGLPISFSIIRRHNGHITVESTEGKGTTFTLYIPAAESHRDEQQSAS